MKIEYKKEHFKTFIGDAVMKLDLFLTHQGFISKDVFNDYTYLWNNNNYTIIAHIDIVDDESKYNEIVVDINVYKKEAF